MTSSRPSRWQDPAGADSPPGGPPRAAGEAVVSYTEHRDALFAVVYSMLGTIADTEDVLQETWLSWAASDRAEVANARGYLLRIAVNQALALMRRRQRSRETYVGPWLPEPLVTGEDAAGSVLQAESVSLALMVVLETLTPLERAVFVLRDAFGYGHGEIAALLGKNVAAVRQLAHRAHEHVHARHQRYKPDPGQQRAVTQRFLAAALGGDVTTLIEVLAPDVTLWTDAGGTRQAALRPVTGRDKLLRLLAAQVPSLPAGLRIRHLLINGEPGALVSAGGTPFGVMIAGLRPEDGRINAVYAVLNPGKLAGVAALDHAA